MKNVTNYLKITFLTLLLSSIGVFQSSAQYCTSNSTVANWSKIFGVSLDGATVSMSNSSSSCGGYQDFTTGLPVPDLVAGATYTLYVFKSNCTNLYQNRCNAWIDWDGDGSFDNNNDKVTTFSWYTGSGDYTHELTFTVPCNVTAGKTRLRIVLNEDFEPTVCNTYGYGETEDYTVELKLPTTVNANFFIPDTAFVGTIVNFVNGTSGSYLNEWDINNDGTIEYTTENVQHIFSSVGTYDVKLKLANCAGADSTVKKIVIVNPTAPTVADFVATQNKVELFDVFNLVDLSTNGPTYWSYYLTDGVDTIYYQGGNPFIHQNPEIFTRNQGSWIP